MKKWYVKVSALLVTTVLLTGCGEVEAVSAIKVEPAHEMRLVEVGEITSGDVEALAAERAANDMLDPYAEFCADQEIDTSREIESSINLLGISALSDDTNGNAENTAVGNMTTMLKAGKEYEVTAQVLINHADTETIEEMVMEMKYPNLVRGEGMTTPLCANLYADSAKMAEDEFRIGSLSYDLVLEYVPGSYRLCQVTGEGDAASFASSENVTWDQLADYDNFSILRYPVDFPQDRATVEYILQYHVRAEVSSGQQEVMQEQASDPMKLKILGFSGNDLVLAPQTESTGEALNDCLRGDYFFSGEITFPDDLTVQQVEEQGVFVVAEVTLPEWALEEGSQNGLIINQYNYLFGGRDAYVLKAELDGYPDDFAAKDQQELVLKGESATKRYIVSGVPVTDLMLWCDPEDGEDSPKCLDTVSSVNFNYDPSRGCEIVSHKISPEQITATEGHFYIVMGYKIILPK